MLCVNLLPGRHLHASQVIAVHNKQPLVQISHFPNRQWQKFDHVCVVRAGNEIACGYVRDTNPDHAIATMTHQPRVITRKQIKGEEQTDLELEFKSYWPAQGDEVHLISHNPRPAIDQLARGGRNELGFSPIALPTSDF